ncbi:hypothetical protein BDZ89DRAFT_777432 [Hymenopellis radicata]|nr:hypothetical protein BDZ89DRAFT_777432 [Hymenopellis radicata]
MATNIPPVEPVPTDAQSSGHPLFSCPYEKCQLPPDFRNRVQDHIKTTHALDKLYPCPEPGCYKAYLSPVDILQHRITRHPRNHICPRYLCQALRSQAHLEYHAHEDKAQRRLKRNASKNTAKQWTAYQPVQDAATKPRSEGHLEVHAQEYTGGAVDGRRIEYQHVQEPATKPKVPKPKKASGRTEHQNPARGFAVDESESMTILDRDFFNHASARHLIAIHLLRGAEAWSHRYPILWTPWTEISSIMRSERVQGHLIVIHVPRRRADT